MGLSNKQSNTQIFKLKSKNLGADPYIAQLEKKGNEWVEGEQGNSYEGIIEGIEFGAYTVEQTGNEQKTLALYFADASKLEMNLNFLSKNIINSLCSIKNLPGRLVEVRVWSGEKYGGVVVLVDGQRAEWEYEPKQVKAVNAQADADDRWIKMAKEKIGSQFEGYLRTGQTQDLPEATVTEATEVNVTDDDLDLPF